MAGAVLERAKQLWHSGRERRALAELSVFIKRCVMLCHVLMSHVAMCFECGRWTAVVVAGFAQLVRDGSLANGKL